MRLGSHRNRTGRIQVPPTVAPLQATTGIQRQAASGRGGSMQPSWLRTTDTTPDLHETIQSPLINVEQLHCEHVKKKMIV